MLRVSGRVCTVRRLYVAQRDLTLRKGACSQRSQGVGECGAARSHHSMIHRPAHHRLEGLSDTLSVSSTAWRLAPIWLLAVEHGAQVGEEESAEAVIVTVGRVRS